MAVQAWTGLSICHGAYHIACNAKAFNAPRVVAAELDTTSLCDTWSAAIGGNKTITWDSSLMQDFAADGLDQLAYASLGTADVPVSLLPAGSTSGSVAHLFSSLALNYTPLEATAGELAMGTLGGRGVGAAARGLLMHDRSAARTSSSSGTAYQLGAVSASQRMYGALHCTAASGTTPSLTVKLQSSATEGGSYTDRITFTALTDEGYQWSNVAGAITDTWWRATWTISGTNPSFTFALSAGIAAA